MGHFDDDDFTDFLSKVDTIDSAIKGLKDGSLTIDDVDKNPDTKELLELADNKQKAKQLQKEKDLQRQIAKQPKMQSREQAIERIKLAEQTGKPELVRMAEEQLRQTERSIQKKKEHDEWKAERTEALREELRASKQRQERWELWQAAHPKYAKKYETNYEAWDKWEPKHEIEDNEDNLMPDSNRPELKAMEEDIEKRARSRKARIKEAEDLKNEGNRAFKEGRFQNACELYGAALSTTPWLTSCFTNRALVHLKLGNYKAAVDDCKEALAVADYNGEKPDSALCLKAHKRKAEGYEGLLKYSKAVRELETALELAPSNQELQQALSETQKRWDQHNKEEEVRARLAEDSSQGAEDCVSQLKHFEAAMKRLSNQQGSPETEADLITAQKQLASTSEARVLFRDLQGIKAIASMLNGDHDAGVLSVLCSACLNEFNVMDILNEKNAIKNIMAVGLSNQNISTRAMALQLLALISDENDQAAQQLGQQESIAAFLRKILLSQQPTFLHNALVIGRNLSAHSDFRNKACTSKLFEVLSEVLETLTAPQDLSDAAGAMLLLLNHTKIREQVSDKMVERAVMVLKTTCDEAAATNILSLLLNACVDEAPRRVLAQHKPAQLLMMFCKQPGTTLTERALGVGARVAQYGEVSAEFVASGLVEVAVANTDAAYSQDIQAVSIRMLAVLVTKCTEPAIKVLKETCFFKTASDLLTLDNESFAGNLSMVISKVASNETHLGLLGSFVQPLVTIMHKTKGATQKNAAIACAKLARNPSYLQQIRDLHGIEIMFHYVKP